METPMCRDFRLRGQHRPTRSYPDPANNWWPQAQRALVDWQWTIETKMEDDWGYPYDLGNPHVIWCDFMWWLHVIQCDCSSQSGWQQTSLSSARRSRNCKSSPFLVLHEILEYAMVCWWMCSMVYFRICFKYSLCYQIQILEATSFLGSECEATIQDTSQNSFKPDQKPRDWKQDQRGGYEHRVPETPMENSITKF